ncbi:MAG TPA: hypothetical protein VJA22_02630 [Patescibacteria group bacterium]|nr:hypothetical protein [Patescibacteria group bacterium]
MSLYPKTKTIEIFDHHKGTIFSVVGSFFVVTIVSLLLKLAIS